MNVLAAPTTSAFAARDWAKVPLVLAGRWPRPLPPHGVVVEPDVFQRWCADVSRLPRMAIDVEGTDEITAIGMAAVGKDHTIMIPWPLPSIANALAIAEMLDGLFQCVPVVGHWVARDIALLARDCGLRWEKALRIDDSGIAHAVRWPGQPHSLVHCTSKYGQWAWTKGTERHTQGDVLGALDTHFAVQREIGPSRMVAGCETNDRMYRYEWHRTHTLPEAIRGWLAGKTVDYRPSVDPTWTLANKEER